MVGNSKRAVAHPDALKRRSRNLFGRQEGSRVKFFFPDSQDLVDPSFDFDSENRSVDRLRHRDDTYAHEVFTSPAYDGLLVSKGIVDGVSGGGKYTLAQRHRLLRVGARDFFRLDSSPDRLLPIMGDCGAFTYFREEVPPYTVDEVLDFYVECGFNFGVSVDHVILAYQPSWDGPGESLAPQEARNRQALTLQLASEFLTKHQSRRLPFEPLGVAQGWSPNSYAASVSALEKMGYQYIAVGGMVPLKTRDILACLESISSVRHSATRLHLLGVTRTENVEAFQNFGVVSFDSTSPLRQAFKDDKDNYYTMDRTYTAIRIPQVEGNPGLQKRIRAGIVSQERARRLERACLESMKQFDAGECSIDETLGLLREYEELYSPGHDHSSVYRQTLTDQPWKHCACDICRRLGYHVILFRGAERNRRRGFHNLWVFYRRLHRELGSLVDECGTSATRKTPMDLFNWDARND
jgi:hypothetical protein